MSSTTLLGVNPVVVVVMLPTLQMKAGKVLRAWRQVAEQEKHERIVMKKIMVWTDNTAAKLAQRSHVLA